MESDIQEESLTASEVVDRLLREAYERGASDLHIDIGEAAVLVRLRIDGHLERFTPLPLPIHAPLIARLKVLAKLRTDEHTRTQDGRFRFSMTETDYIDVRLSTAPTLFGENAVLRLLSSTHETPHLEDLGVLPPQTKLLNTSLSRTQGLILITGPTGCGKTTTLYSMLRLAAKRPVSLVTIEDPVEYSIPEAVQMQVNVQAGFTFVEGLRGILRQDPDVIMVGEIRDAETAELAINAALTGHLVLSTLHTNNAMGVVPRLINLCIDPYLISACQPTIVAQRLVRRICTNCKTTKTLSPHEVVWLEGALGTTIPNAVPYGSGCEACGGKGYKGRIGLFDVIRTLADLRGENVLDIGEDCEELQTAFPLIATGMDRVASGFTTVEELLSLSYAEFH